MERSTALLGRFALGQELQDLSTSVLLLRPSVMAVNLFTRENGSTVHDRPQAKSVQPVKVRMPTTTAKSYHDKRADKALTQYT